MTSTLKTQAPWPQVITKKKRKLKLNGNVRFFPGSAGIIPKIISVLDLSSETA